MSDREWAFYLDDMIRFAERAHEYTADLPALLPALRKLREANR